jgi:hypothetical protein
MDYYVIKNPISGSWEVRGKNHAVFSRHATQASAYESARNLCHNSGGGEVIVWGLDGKIQYRNTISPKKDAFPPRG